MKQFVFRVGGSRSLSRPDQVVGPNTHTDSDNDILAITYKKVFCYNNVKMKQTDTQGWIV